jgi:hypothetical protein
VSNSTFFQSVRGARSERPIGFIGEFRRNGDFRSITGVNQDPQAKQVTTITVPAAPDDSTDYTVTIDGVACTYAADADSTQDEVGAGLEAAINAEPGARAKCVASYTGGTLTLTGVWPGVSFTTEVNSDETTQDLGTPSDDTSAAEADAISFGRVVASDGYVTDEGNPKVFVPTTSKFTAQVISLTFAGNTASYYTGTVWINGKAYNWGGVVWNTDLDTTCTDIATAINAVMPTETVIAASVGSAGGVVTLTAEVEGAEFDAVANAVGHASAEATKAYTTGPSRSTSLKRAIVGISVRRLDVENETVDGDDPSYAANAGVEVCTRGAGVLQRDTSETWAWGDEVWVSLASATKGRIYNSASTDRVWLGQSVLRIERSEHSTTTDGVGIVRVDMGA